MPSASFVDTNVLIYAAAGGSEYPQKWEIAQDLLRDGQLCLSGQVLAEFFHNCRKKKLIPGTEIEVWLLFLSTLNCAAVDETLVLEGARLSERHRISYWDAALIAAARRLEANVIYTEDLNHGQEYDGVKAINPFV